MSNATINGILIAIGVVIVLVVAGFIAFPGADDEPTSHRFTACDQYANHPENLSDLTTEQLKTYIDACI